MSTDPQISFVKVNHLGPHEPGSPHSGNNASTAKARPVTDDSFFQSLLLMLGVCLCCSFYFLKPFQAHHRLAGVKWEGFPGGN